MIHKPYPYSICTPCAEANNAKWPNSHVAGFWIGECGVCEKKTYVTGTRDWQYPDIEGFEKQERLTHNEYLCKLYGGSNDR